jgi:hypothetical protein
MRGIAIAPSDTRLDSVIGLRFHLLIENPITALGCHGSGSGSLTDNFPHYWDMCPFKAGMINDVIIG